MWHVINIVGAYLALFVALRMVAPDAASALARYGRPLVILLSIDAAADALPRTDLSGEWEIGALLGYAVISGIGYFAWRRRQPPERVTRRIVEQRRDDGAPVRET